MKKLYLLGFLTFGYFLNLNAQITITIADLPQPSHTYYTSTDTTPSISLGSPGSIAQSWDFSSLSEDYPSVPTYGLTSLTPYAGVFTTSNIYTYGPAALYSSLSGGAPVSSQGMNKGYMFWKTDVSGFWTIGFRADSGSYANTNVHYAPSELLIGTPCTYGTGFINYGRWEFPMNKVTTDVDTYYVSTVDKTLNGDAFGDLTLPSGNYANVLRIHEHVVKVDSVYAKFGSTTVYAMELLRDTLNNYIYMANSIGYPLSIVHADVNNIVKNVEYYNLTLTLGNNEVNSAIQDEIKIYPNPVDDFINFIINTNSNTKISYAITDISGRIIMNHSENLFLSANNPIRLNLNKLNKGTYFLTVDFNGKSSVLPFIKL